MGNIKYILITLTIGTIILFVFSATVSIDSDGLSVLKEISKGTDPLNSDTDGDGLQDNIEINGNTDTLEKDSDGDGINDYVEFKLSNTDPTKSDTDDDSLDDGTEINKYNTDPTSKDTDGDGVLDGHEVKLNTDPTSKDTDGDILNDSYELYKITTDPLDNDTDGDNLNDGKELNQLDTDPLDNDTDNDGLTDYEEIKNYQSNPVITDTDGDGLDDVDEISNNTNPTMTDSDEDGLTDYSEITNGTNPTKSDTDNDGLKDGIEVNRYGSDPNSKYTIENGLNDTEQHNYNINPSKDPTLSQIPNDVQGILKREFLFNYSSGVDRDNDGYSDYFERNSSVFDKNKKNVVVEVVWTDSNDPSVSTLLNIREAYNESSVDNGRGISIIFYLIGESGLSSTVKSENYYEQYQKYYADKYGSHHVLFAENVIIEDENLAGFAYQNYPSMIVASDDRDRQTGSTLMHEIGHSLGLSNDGYAGIDSTNKSFGKYPSVMNYNSFEPCSRNISKCYKYSNGKGYNDWKFIEQNLESGIFIPNRSYNSNRNS